jgi:NADPH:quinone reductase
LEPAPCCSPDADPKEFAMKAAYFEAPGPPDVIRYGDLPTPEPQAGEVRVRVVASAVNPIDTYIRSGAVSMVLPQPFIPGCDLAGTIDAVGPNVKRFRTGDRVWGSNQGILGRQGAFAEYCCAQEDFLYPLPDNVSEEAAAALALVGITAHLGLFWRTNLKAGETVFVNGGTGGVGQCVVQMAKAVGAKVIATVGSAEKAQLATTLGADVVINYNSENISEVVAKETDGKGVDLFFETLAPTNLDQTIERMAKHGRIVVMAGRQARPHFPNGPFYVKGLSMFGFVMFGMSADAQRACANDINTWTASGVLKPVIGRVFPLNEAVSAHQLQEANTQHRAGTLIGKIVVKPG